MHLAPTRAGTTALAVLLLAAAVLAALFGAPAQAAATPVTAMSIALMYESPASDDPTLVISARVAEDVPLPVEMVLPAPEGANVLWVGEFFGDQGRENLPVQFTLEERDGAPALVFTLTQSRIGLAEIAFPGSRTLVDNLGDVYEVGFDLTSPVDAVNVFAAVALPADVEALESSEPVAVSDEPDGNRYHSFERADVVAGDRIALTMQVRPIVEQEVVNETVPWMIIGVLAVIAAALVLLIVTVQRRNSGTTEA